MIEIIFSTETISRTVTIPEKNALKFLQNLYKYYVKEELSETSFLKVKIQKI